jgi:integrase
VKRTSNKTDIRYWVPKVGFHTSESRTLSVQIQDRGQRKRIGLGTADKQEAAVKARDLYLKIKSNGWEDALQWLKSNSAVEPTSTLEEFLSEVRAKSELHPKTIQSYSWALSQIAREISGTSNPPLSILTTPVIEGWKSTYVRAHNGNPIAERSAHTSVNSLLGRARSLFGPKVVARIKDRISLPDPLPFTGIRVQRPRANKYRSTFNFKDLLVAAKEELPDEQLKIFLLGAMSGLRRNEIDKLTWDAFIWNESLIRIKATEHFRPKSHSSEGDIPACPDMMALFREFKDKSSGKFVIESDSSSKLEAKAYGQYRCHTQFRKLISWLRSKGVAGKTPLHSLRKEFGSQINHKYGLVAASEMLRHSDISITASHYIEPKVKPVLSMSALLAAE